MAQAQRQPAQPAQPASPAQPREQQPQRSQQDPEQGAFEHIQIGPSSNIASVDYNAKTLDLIITFVSGAAYHYSNVDQVAISGISSAASPGRYFNANIKGQFEYEQIS